MPFVSKAQLRTCYSRRPKGWDCDEFQRATPSICCLPEKKGYPVKTRCMKNGERIVGKVQTGPRGGRFFIIEERDSKGTVCTIRVYLPKNRK